MTRRVSATGSCARCRRALDLAAVKRGAHWYCRASCARGDQGPGGGAPAEPRLINRPRRLHRRRAPKELRALSDPGRSG